ncbi:MAG TPA: EAL domain-containing protein [Jatrophihabitans sp.]|nr:EAL domain-containing protein [Jatrophihabitans sp.]
MEVSARLLFRRCRFSFVWWPTVLGGWAVLAWAIWHAAPELSRLHNGVALAMCAALLVFLELLPLVQGRGHDPQGVVMSTAFVCALLLVWGLDPAVVMVCLAAAVSDLRAGKAWWKLAFNVGQYSLSVGAGFLVMMVAGHTPSLQDSLLRLGPSDLIWIVGVWIAYFTVNLFLVMGVVSQGRAFLPVLLDDLGHYTTMTFAVLGLSPVIVLLAQKAWWLLPALLIPLLLLYWVAQMSLAREHEAMHDPLTGLANRASMEFALTEALTDRGAHDPPLSLLLIDLDHFKEVNDTLGHHMGDELLTTFAQRLTSAVRTGDHVTRLGGDEFAVIAPAADADAALAMGRRILDELQTPFTLDGITVDVGASIGLAIYPEHADNAKDLLRVADVAMYNAKSGGLGITVYSRDRDANRADRLSLLGELRQALLQQQLELHYQPKVALADGSLLGVEALVRWRHPERGLIPPDEFIPLAERSGLMPMLTKTVLGLALKQIAGWHHVGLDVEVAVNVTLPDVIGGQLDALISAARADRTLPDGALQVEITERVMGQHNQQLSAAMQQLQHLGVKFSLDDFGTGYSSLLRLQSLPVNELKIDRTFIAKLSTDPTARGIVGSTIDLAHALGLPAIAEGVETDVEWQLLARLGCDGAQGWHIARPMPAEQATEWIAGRLASHPRPAERMTLSAG